MWNATGRINVLDRLGDTELDRLVANGLREVALGIESGSDRVLTAMDKRITAAMTERVARRLVAHGIGIKAYFILVPPGSRRMTSTQPSVASAPCGTSPTTAPAGAYEQACSNSAPDLRSASILYDGPPTESVDRFAFCG
ncbi:hypothetical protein [Streptomyces sp. NPDC056061]|uniref:hypothetical protein n=1 Tax=Streptomyces sp. NPDC056061 TaxID=3345700 RepID=UPI0035E3AE5B